MTSGSLEEIKRQLEQVFGPTLVGCVTASDFGMTDGRLWRGAVPASHAGAGSAGYWDLLGG